MFQYIFRAAICGIFINLSGLSASVTPAPATAGAAATIPPLAEEEKWVSNARVNHLPQPMRQTSLDFFDRFVQLCAELNHRPEDTALTTVGAGSVIDKLAPAGEVVNRVDTPFVRFMDKTLFVNGWGRTPRHDYPNIGDVLDFESDIAVPAGDIPLIPVAIVELIRDETELTNPVAQYFRAIMHMRGIRSGTSADAARNPSTAGKLLIQSMKALCHPAARILAEGTGGVDALPYAKTYELLTRDSHDEKKKLFKSFIDNRGNHAKLSRHDMRFLDDVILSLPGDTGRWYDIIGDSTFELHDAFNQAMRPEYSLQRIGKNVIMGGVQTAASLGYFNFSDSPDDGATWGEGSVFVVGAALNWAEAVDEIVWACMLI